MADNWVAPTVPPVFNVGATLLLTDGTLFAQDSSTANWWRLRPDRQSDYAKGRWAKAASARQARRSFTSAVLPDGRVFIAGGQSAELYDPAIDRWTDLPAPAGWPEIGQALCRVLPNGGVLLGHATSGACAIYDADAEVWRPTTMRRRPGLGRESWTLLGDGSVLAVSSAGKPSSERYIGGAWRDEGAPPPGFIREPATPAGPAVRSCSNMTAHPWPNARCNPRWRTRRRDRHACFRCRTARCCSPPAAPISNSSLPQTAPARRAAGQ